MERETKIVEATIDFVAHVHAFYGSDPEATYLQICEAIKVLLDREGIKVCYNGDDRERVREILISNNRKKHD